MKKQISKRTAIFIFLFALILGPSPAQDLKFKHSVIAPEICSQARQTGDFNNDGRGDILVVEGEFKPVQFAWYEYPDWKKHEINNKELSTLNYVADCSVADVDNDGDMDIIIPDAHDNPPAGVPREMRVLWFENPLTDTQPSKEWAKHIIAELGSVSCLKDIEVADFNHDGKLDVAVRGEVDFYAFYQNTPQEWKSVSFPVKGHEGMASGDIDHDGFIDMVLNGFWLKNPGGDPNGIWKTYTFDPKWYNQNTGSWMDNNVQVRVADMNLDGLPDIVISNSEKPGYPVSWYKAPKDPVNGTWLEQEIGQLDYCHSLQPGDFDNDGDVDLLAAEMKKEKSAGRMVLFLNEDSPQTPDSWKEKTITWKEQIISDEGAYWAVIGDLGGDGDLDILSSRRYDLPPIEIWENRLCDNKQSLDKWSCIEVDNKRGSWGEFDEPKWLKYFGVAAGDMSNDGHGDIISGRYCYINPGGDMSSAWNRIDLGKNVDAMIAVDVDGDEFGDIIAEALPDIYWLEALNEGGTSWRAIQVARIPPPGHHNSQGYALTQIFPGGKPEILFESGEGVYCIEIPASPETGGWPTLKLTGRGTHAEGIGTGDVDGDGYIDVATGMGWKGVVWWKNPGNRTENWNRYEVGRINRDYIDKVAVADINGDGRNDIVVSEELYPDIQPGQAYWFEQPVDPTEEPALFNWERHDISGEKYTLNNMNVRDMDKDGDIDVVVAEHKGSKNTFVYENDGKGNFTGHVAAKGKEGHGGAFLFDLDDDGDTDIIHIAWEDYKFLYLIRNDAIKK